MKCPICGEEIAKGKHKCLRCGYEVRELSSIVIEPEEEVTPTVEIDPSKVHISGGSRPSNGGIFDDFFGGSLFGGGLFGGILDGLFGGFFDGFDDRDEEENVDYDDFGSPISKDIYDRDFVELKAHEVEYIDDKDGEKLKSTHNGAQKDYDKESAHNGEAHHNKKGGDKKHTSLRDKIKNRRNHR